MADGWKFHTPNEEGNAVVICRRLALPSFLWKFFFGAYGELIEEANWLGVGSMTAGDVVQAFAMALDGMDGCFMVGEFRCFVSLAAVAPDCLVCDGSSFDGALYPDLAAVMGGNTLPDMRDRFLIGAGAKIGVGAVGGESQHTLTLPEIPEHWHSYTPPTFNVDVEAPGAPDLLAAGIGVSSPTGVAGGGLPHNNMPPYIGVVWAVVAR